MALLVLRKRLLEWLGLLRQLGRLGRLVLILLLLVSKNIKKSFGGKRFHL